MRGLALLFLTIAVIANNIAAGQRSLRRRASNCPGGAQSKRPYNQAPFPKSVLCMLLMLVAVLWGSAADKLPKTVMMDRIYAGERMLIESSIYNQQRIILLSLPSDYAGNDNRYPVIYFTDGSVERLRFLRGLVDFFVNLDQIPDAILVGIVHADRNQELQPPDPEPGDAAASGPTRNMHGDADRLLLFMKQELFPLIESQYRTLPSRIYVGHSTGGLFGLYGMQKYPAMFNAQIDVDPTLWLSLPVLDSLAMFFDKNPVFQNSLFVSHTAQMGKAEQYVKLNGILNRTGHPQFKYSYLELPPAVGHNLAVLPTVANGLLKIFAEYAVSVNADMTFRDYQAHFAEPILGAVYPLSETRITNFYRQKMHMEKWIDAIDAYTFYTALHPQSAVAFAGLGDAYWLAGRKNLAIVNYEKALDLNPQNNKVRMRLEKIKETDK